MFQKEAKSAEGCENQQLESDYMRFNLDIQFFGGRGADSQVYTVELSDGRIRNFRQEAKQQFEAVYNGDMQKYKADHGGNTPSQYAKEAAAMLRQNIKAQKDREKNGARKITSSTYEKAQKNTQKKVDAWFGMGRR